MFTYGGMSGRDMDALAVGLDENTEFETARRPDPPGEAAGRPARRVRRALPAAGRRPCDLHRRQAGAAQPPQEQFIAQTLAVELYLEAGIRGVEIGSILADRDPETHENRYPALELLRLAIPRRVYTDNHIRVIAAACRNIYERRHEITLRLPHHLRGSDPAPLHRGAGADLIPAAGSKYNAGEGVATPLPLVLTAPAAKAASRGSARH